MSASGRGRGRMNSRWLVAGLYASGAVLTGVWTGPFEALLRSLFPQFKNVIYQGATPAELMVDHLLISLYSSAFGLLLAVLLSAVVLSRLGQVFRDVLLNLANFLQTVPSVAVIGIVVPVIGYGMKPVIIALVAYSVLPVMLNIVTGIESVAPELVEAAEGLGMTKGQILFRVKVPLALPIIVAGIKNMVIINVSAATLGALVGAGGLGMPIMAGIHDFNPAFIIQGAMPAAFIALFLDELIRYEREDVWQTQ
jgi:osmoprotectant transport system permease protein